MTMWEPLDESRGQVRVSETSCCGAYEFVCQGGEFLVVRHNEDGEYEETGRGRHVKAFPVWCALVAEHMEGEHNHPCARLPLGRHGDGTSPRLVPVLVAHLRRTPYLTDGAAARAPQVGPLTTRRTVLALPRLQAVGNHRWARGL